MENRTKPQAYSLFHFLRVMTRQEAWLFAALMLILGISALCMVYLGLDPLRWALHINAIPEEVSREVTLDHIHRHYRSFDLRVTAFGSATTYGAEPMLPAQWMVVLFSLVQILAWPVLLAAATRIRNAWCYPLYFLFAVWLYLGGWAEFISPTYPTFVAAGILVAFLVPAYLFQQEILKASLLLRILCFFLLMAALYAWGWAIDGWYVWNSAASNSFILYLLLVIIYTYLTGNDLLQMVVFAGLNRQNAASRMGNLFILPASVVLILWTFFLFQHFAGFNLVPYHPGLFRPLSLLAVVSILSLGLKQNVWPNVRDHFRDNAAFSFLYLAFSLIVISTIVFNTAIGSDLFLYLTERHASFFFFLLSLFFLFYLYYNFSSEIGAKESIYFILMRPGRLLYIFVIALVLLISLGLEAKDGNKTVKIYFSISEERAADGEALKGQTERAIAGYKGALQMARGNLRAGYNSGTLLLSDPDRRTEAATTYRELLNESPFAPAALNLGNLERMIGDNVTAINELRSSLSAQPDAYVANNLAYLYEKVGKPDSAIDAYKKALLIQPKNPEMLCNLGLIYLQKDKKAESRQFIEAGIHADRHSRSAVTNSIFHNLVFADSIDMNQADLRDKGSADFSFDFDQALLELRKGNFSSASERLKKILEDNPTYGPALLLDGLIMFESGKVEEALSRFKFIDVTFPSLKGDIAHLLAIEYFRNGAPEMAAEYFRKSGETGNHEDHLHAVEMEIDAGNHDYAQNQLNLVRVLYETLWKPAAKEMAMLLKAYGQPDLAYTEWDFKDITEDEMTRISLYAGQAGNIVAALENFREMIGKDSSSVIPYLEMGRIYLKALDTLALENLEYGRRKSPGDPQLMLEMANALALSGRLEQASVLCDSALIQLKGDPDAEYTRLGIRYLAGDTLGLTSELEKLNHRFPLHKKTILLLGNLYRIQGRSVEGYTLFYNATQLNDRNADLWFGLANFARELGELNIRDAGYAAVKAIEFSYSEKRKLEIAGMFSKEIRYLSESE